MLFRLIIILLCSSTAIAQSKKPINVIGYFAGSSRQADSICVKGLTHIIYSFAQVKNGAMHLDSKNDTLALHKIIARKKQFPRLKILIALGGWGGCLNCSDVFKTETGRNAFAASALKLLTYFKADGIDMDWEFPALASAPGQSFDSVTDKHNFTLVMQALRRELKNKYELSFAAGGFKLTLNKSIEWDAVMNIADRVHLMTYDFQTHGTTGHHTSLYSTDKQKVSADQLVQFLINEKHVPREKIVIGSAMYGRAWENVTDENNGLYAKASPIETAYRYYELIDFTKKGYVLHRDTTAQAPYLYHSERRSFISFDDPISVKEKVRYIHQQALNGIMFWQIRFDTKTNGLISAVTDESRKIKK